MEEAKGVVKHVLLAKFKDSVTQEKQEQLIKGYANLVPLIEPMKAFHWKRGECYSAPHCRGRDVSIENLHQGYTHVFESTFESVEGISEYVAHPAHVEFANEFLAALDKFVIIDYKPSTMSS